MNEAVQLLITIIVAEIIAQTTKLFTHKRNVGYFDFHILTSDGGMPSGHSTTVATLSTYIFLLEGFSTLFIAVLFFSLIVLRDATGVRRAAGRQAHVLNELIKKEHMKSKKLKELLGHTPKQMIAGVILGIIIALISYNLF